MKIPLRPLGFALGLALALAASNSTLAQTPVAPPGPPASTAQQTPAAIAKALLDGIAFAKSQLAVGRLETMRLGPPPSPEESERIAAIERHGISVLHMGNVIDAGLVAYVDANNAIMEAAIRQKHGDDFWERVDREIPMPDAAEGARP